MRLRFHKFQDLEHHYDSGLKAWCVWLLHIGDYAIGLECNHKRWMRVHVEIFTKDCVNIRKILRIDVGYPL